MTPEKPAAGEKVKYLPRFFAGASMMVMASIILFGTSGAQPDPDGFYVGASTGFALAAIICWMEGRC